MTKLLARSITPIWYLSSLFIVAVLFNYPWEIAQGFLFFGMGSAKGVWWHCFIASLGDGVIIWIIYLTGWRFFRQPDWFVEPYRAKYLVMIGTGFSISIAVEWLAVHVLHRWSYMEQMPIIPVLNIGLIPILQMLLLPAWIFHLVAKWAAHRARLSQDD
jgi:hypothetical protein